MDYKRRNLLKGLALAPIALGTQSLFSNTPSTSKLSTSSRVKYSVNAFTFNDMLRNGEMDFFDMMDFASDIGLDAVDLTCYYFEGYPKATIDSKMLFKLKKKALALGLDITWTGVRNNFVKPDETSRANDMQMIKDWLKVSSKLGAAVMRVFAGKGRYTGYSKDQVKEWMVAHFKECAKYAEETGVITALQHHNDFLYDADEVIDILKRVNSEWFGLILDIGSLRRGNPYEEIEKLAPFANYWFVKELVYVKGVSEPVNMKKIANILIKNNYKGYISFESLTEGDPKEIVTTMFNDFKTNYSQLKSTSKY
ncbi:sugar phosphate isomerase/epimerase [Polaribacter sp. WD7]|uniref:sugar phosphate isomerase/epimerase family protein n=1 Tax=Polaribacter sp. WD7 TaxID=2269061 RepID=UPI000DF4971B|nr:sugar phosphate isomerase/epimerase family protein [Polaribacter sp. WD7]RCS26779.1 sugar phosphate isomerase/epimerase [Polaribacter sp. WD7]